MKELNYIKVAVHGVPRSGTSWIGEILNSSPNSAYRYQPLFSYAHKDYLCNSSSKDDIDLFFKRLLNCDDPFTNQSDKRAIGDFPTFYKEQITHVIYKEVRYMNILFNLMRRTEDVLLVAVMRNPLSVINSWLRAPREFRKDLGWSEMEEWRYATKKNLNRPEEFNGYEKWKEAANIFTYLKRQYPNRVYILKYNKVLKMVIDETKNLFNFCSLKFTKATDDFLKSSISRDNKDAYSVFRLKPNDEKWKTQLPPAIAEKILDDLKGTLLEEYVET